MKRSTALLLALATLLAHVLALHQDVRGGFGPPADRAHVAFRLGRHLVQGMGAVWNAGDAFTESYPSWAWVGLSAISEGLRLPPTRAAQILAILAALLAVIVVSRFSPDRLAGVIAPLFVVVSGSLASAASTGTELTMFALLWCLTLFALESGRSKTLAIALAAACLVRPEGLLLALALLALALASRSRRRAPDELVPGQARVPLRWFAVPFLVWGAMALVRHSLSGSWLSPTLSAALVVDPVRLEIGGRYLLDFFLRSGAPLLVVLPVVLFPFGLSPRGRRALLMGLAWCAWIAWIGGDSLPFWAALAPAIPPLAVATQEALVVGIDSRFQWPRSIAWTLFIIGLLASVIASKQPTDLGPIPLDRWHRAWLDVPETETTPEFTLPFARAGELEALQRDERLRTVGVFIRDHLPESVSVLTPWPGSIGYLSRRRVYDMLGRATPIVEGQACRAYEGPLRSDLAAALDVGADYIVPTILRAPRPPLLRELVTDWARQLDTAPESFGRSDGLWRRIRRYELVSVPVSETSADIEKVSREPLYLLRQRSLGLQPEVRVQVRDRRVIVEVRHRGHVQLVDLEIIAQTATQQELRVSPTGEVVPEKGVHARTGIRLEPTGERAVRLFEGTLPEKLDLMRVVAVLRNPGSQDEQLFSTVSEPAVARLR